MSDLDDLMDLDPLALSDRDLDAIIAYHRNRRATDGAPKARGAKGTPETKAALSALVKGMTTKDSTPNSKSPGAGKGLRRV